MLGLPALRSLSHWSSSGSDPILIVVVAAFTAINHLYWVLQPSAPRSTAAAARVVTIPVMSTFSTNRSDRHP